MLNTAPRPSKAQKRVPFRRRIKVLSGVWGRHCPYTASPGRGNAEVFPFISPLRAQDTSQMKRGRLPGRKGRPQRRTARAPGPPCSSSPAAPTLPHFPPGWAEVGEGWKPRDCAAEAEGRRRFPSNGRPAPSHPAWRGGAGKRGAGRRCYGSASAPPDAGGTCRKLGLWAPRELRGDLPPPHRQLQLRSGGDLRHL